MLTAIPPMSAMVGRVRGLGSSGGLGGREQLATRQGYFDTKPSFWELL
jgi:hypothetical protein